MPSILEVNTSKILAHIGWEYAFSWSNHNKKILVDGIFEMNAKILTVLDVGSASGGYSKFLLEKFPYCHLLVGVDISREAISRAKAELDSRVNYILADAHALPFTKRSFSLVFAKDLMHHVKNPVEILKELKEITKGEVVVVEANRPNHIMVLCMHVCAKHQHFTLDQVKNLISRADMELKNCKQLHAYPFHLFLWPIKNPFVAMWNIFIFTFHALSCIIPWLPIIGLKFLSSFTKPSFNILYAQE